MNLGASFVHFDGSDRGIGRTYTNKLRAEVGYDVRLLHVLVIDPLIYAEVSIAYSTIEDAEAALPADIFRREPLPFEAAFLAGKAFLEHRRRGGSRHAPLPDFFIGAHAAVAGSDC